MCPHLARREPATAPDLLPRGEVGSTVLSFRPDCELANFAIDDDEDDVEEEVFTEAALTRRVSYRVDVVMSKMNDEKDRAPPSLFLRTFAS